MTPRRIALTIIGILVFGAAYTIYDRLLGWIDGLPLLLPRMLLQSNSNIRPPSGGKSPTTTRLEEAFGEKCPESEPAFYPTQLEFRNVDTSTVVAAGQAPSSPRSKRVLLSPFSAAVFSKPRPEHLRQPGEINEITTFHSDKAVLVFDEEINTPVDMSTKKLVRIELISDPEKTLPDPRRGMVHISNNQRSSDPNRRFLLKTIGPVFYRDSKAKEFAGKQPLLGPDIWTDAAIEAVDFSNIPHLAGVASSVAPTVSEEVRNPAVVASILSGQRLPPPTLTALGLRVYLASEDPAKKQQSKGNGGFSGVRRIELIEQVVMSLWMEGGQGLVGSEGKASTTPASPAAALGVAGGLVGAADSIRELSRDLLQIETRGPFAYDAEKNLARFDVLPQADPNLTNDVRATKIPPRDGLQTLYSQVLEIEFNGSAVGASEPQSAKNAKPVPVPTPGGKPPAPGTGGGPQFKRLHAWTYTPGRFLTISSDSDQLVAYGQDVIREQSTEMTQLTGYPLYAVQQKSVLTAGSQSKPGILISEPVPGAKGGERRTKIQGMGRIEIYDPAAKANTLAAAWQKEMVQTKVPIQDRMLDFYTFTEKARIEDMQSDYWLNGNEIKLWMAPAPPEAGEAAKTAKSNAGTGPSSKSQLDRLLAIGDVTGHTGELDIEFTEELDARFRDIPPPETPESPPAPVPAAPGLAAAVQPVPPPGGPLAPAGPADGPAQPREPEKPKPPMKIKARKIDSTVVRYPQPKPPAGAVAPPPAAPGPGENNATGGMKYQIEHARCEGMVIAHQDPEDPSKPRGTDIIGSLLLIDSTPDGSKLTVYGWDFPDFRPGEVHNEGTSLIGPKVTIDQLHNYAEIEGRGTLVMPANSDLTGGDLKKTDPQPDQKSDPVVIHFRDKMTFEGSKKVARFFGKVNAAQGESWILCHTMEVIFDRPVYFSQTNRPSNSAKPATSTALKPPANPSARVANGGPGPGSNPDDDKAKIDVVYCYPAPADTADSRQEREVMFTQLERDPQTGKPNRKQQLTAKELTIRAQVKDEGRGEPYKMVLAFGPGVMRMWGPESKEDEPGTGTSKQTGTVKPLPAEVEMKLTVVFFSGRMFAKDKGDIYKEATFLDHIQVINVPTENPDLPIERHKVSLAALRLDCSEKLIVWSHKNPRMPDAPAKQSMHAFGNAFLQNEKWDGWGEVIRSEGKVVWLDGTGLMPAHIKSRFENNDQAGQQIRFERDTNRYTINNSLGGTIIDGAGPDDNSRNKPNATNPTMNENRGYIPKN